MRLFNVDIVNAKSGKKLTRLEKFANEAVNFLLHFSLVSVAIFWCLFVLYLAFKFVTFLINV